MNCIKIWTILCVAVFVETAPVIIDSTVQSVAFQNSSLHSTWTGSSGQCINVRNLDLVYYTHAHLQPVSSSSSVTSNYSWSGSKTIYCMEIVTNFGTTGRITVGGVGYKTTSLEAKSLTGNDLEIMIYIYAD
ncbi:uncharacterized protein LOC132697374 [Cylas formicarius]|uniref:uncharacterized protein LOC132697374 n=1 Tax=Cylas formicarius TaxID=197179 RepID=UPI002958A314|nr:uncharacterized protein LOC132697374 [Cylas formicarius]